MKTSWREKLQFVLKANLESFADIVSNTMTDEQMDAKFDSGYGGVNGTAFIVWTTNYVYFPLMYDGSECVGCVARNPNGQPTSHQGG
jgi:hypothetical protein